MNTEEAMTAICSYLNIPSHWSVLPNMIHVTLGDPYDPHTVRYTATGRRRREEKEGRRRKGREGIVSEGRRGRHTERGEGEVKECEGGRR